MSEGPAKAEKSRLDRALDTGLLAAPWLLLFVGSTLRLLCTRFDFPNPTHPDEWTIVRTAGGMLRRGDLDPNFFNYPSFVIYLETALLKVAPMLGLPDLVSGPVISVNEPVWFESIHLGRVAVALLGGATVLATYHAGRILKDRPTGILAALLLVFSVLHLRYTHTLTVDGPTTFFVACALVAAARLTKAERRWHHYLLGGVAVGLAAGSKYTAGLALLPLLVAHVVGARQQGERLVDPRLLLALAGAPLAFAITTPYAVLEPSSVQAALEEESRHYRGGHPGFEAAGAHAYVDYFLELLESWGPSALVLSAWGVAVSLFKKEHRGTAVVLLSFVLVFAALIGWYKVHFARNLLPLTPYLAVFAGLGLSVSLGAYLRRPAGDGIARKLGVVTLAAGLFLLVSYEAWRGADYVRVLQLPDTRAVATRWIEANLPEGSQVVVELYAPRISEERYDVVWTNLNGLIKFPHVQRGADYLVSNADEYERYLVDHRRYPDEAQGYRALFAEHPEVRRFEGDNVTMQGPTIRILRTLHPDESPKTARKTDTPAEEPSRPSVHAGMATVGEGLPRDRVRRAASLQLPAMGACYADAFREDPTLQGRIVVRFTVRPDGRVDDVSIESSTVDFAELETCVVEAFDQRRFPQPTNGGDVQVSYPFVFTAAD